MSIHTMWPISSSFIFFFLTVPPTTAKRHEVVNEIELWERNRKEEAQGTGPQHSRSDIWLPSHRLGKNKRNLLAVKCLVLRPSSL